MNSRIFLGGTCAETTWRNELMPLLNEQGVEYFNPVVDDWTPECQAIEEEEKNRKCNIHLYVITPEMQGVYSIAEIIHSAHLSNIYGTSVDMIVFCILKSDKWDKKQMKSLRATEKLVSAIAPHSSIVYEAEDMNDLFDRLFNMPAPAD